MAVTYQILFDIIPGKQATFLDLLTPVLDAMRHEHSFIDAQLFQDPGAPDRLMLIETWADHDEVITVQILRPYRAAYTAALPALLNSPRDIRVWQPLRSDNAALMKQSE